MSVKALPNYRWIKFGLAYLDDQDFMRLENATIGVYVKLYLLAAWSGSGGLLSDGHRAFDQEHLAWRLRTDVKTFETCLGELVEAGLVKIDQDGFWISRFMEEQGPGDNVQRAKWVERQRKMRAKVVLPE